jgi:hypothetical protein
VSGWIDEDGTAVKSSVLWWLVGVALMQCRVRKQHQAAVLVAIMLCDKVSYVAWVSCQSVVTTTASATLQFCGSGTKSFYGGDATATITRGGCDAEQQLSLHCICSSLLRTFSSKANITRVCCL